MAIKLTPVPEKGFRYVPISEVNEEKPFAVWVKPLGAKDLMFLEDRMVERGENNSTYYAINTYACRVLQKAFASWEHLEDENGVSLLPVIDHLGQLSDSSLSMIPVDIISEVAGVVTRISKDPKEIQILFGE